MLNNTQKYQQLSAIEMAEQLSQQIQNTINKPSESILGSFCDLFDENSLFILEEMTECDYIPEPYSQE